jgi:uncharacterized protein (DUF427 family)
MASVAMLPAARRSCATPKRLVEHPTDKERASYYSIPAGGERSVNAIWTYEEPYEAVAAIRDHVAFYRDRVDSIGERAR